MNKMIEAIELIHQNAVCLFKIGNFYHTYGKDSYTKLILVIENVDFQ